MIKQEKFKNVIDLEQPLVMDGALGTELYNRGVFINRCFEDANLSTPDLVKKLHEDYVAAGAGVVTTNSWGANHVKLSKHNLHDKVKAINVKAVELAKYAADGKAWVLGSMGPLGVRIEPFGPTSFLEARRLFSEQASALIGGGVDAISLETFSDLSEMQQAIVAIRELDSGIPIIGHTVITEESRSPYGSSVEWVIKKLDEWPIDVIGLNCSVGPQPMMTCIPKIKKISNKPLSVRPNAGLPKHVDGRYIYMSTPEYLAHFAKEFFNAGVQFVGGCCGTSPEHIKAMANTLRYARATLHAESASTQVSSEPHIISSCPHEVEEKERIPLARKSAWSKAIAEGEQVYSVELLPPAGVDPSKIISKSKQVKEAGIHAINIPDGPRASSRMSAMLTAVMIEQHAGIETVLHYTCRDRNLLGMQSDMLGAHAVGLRNMLLVTGDPPKLGNYPDATGVFDVDAIGLTNMVHRLNGGLDLGSRSIGEPAALSIGVGVNPVHRDFNYEMKRFAWKVDAGAEWAITQPVFDVNALFNFLEYIDKHKLKIPIIAGIWPLVSYRNALFMNNEVPGVVIPEEIIKRMEKPRDPEDAKKLGVEIANEMVQKLGTHVQGIQVSAPFGRIDLALSVIDR